MRRRLALAALAAALVVTLAVLGPPWSRPPMVVADSSFGVAVIGTTFLPSQNGLPFVNPVAPPHGSLIQRVTTEQCGGMAFTAIDYFRNGEKPPGGLTATSSSIRERSAQSVVANGWRFVLWTVLPDRSAHRIPGVGDLTRAEELGKLTRELQRGPVPLGLVRARRLSSVGLNHQVVAYEMAREGDRVFIYIYDPVQPGSDNVRLELDVSRPASPIVERRDDWVTAEWRGLFVERYVPRVDPSAAR